MIETPNGLAERGEAFWSTVTSKWDLSPPELEILVEVCRTLDALEVLAGDKAKLSEARQHRLVLHRLLAALELPEDDGIASPATLRARKAARTRWDASAGIRESRRSS